MKKLMIALAAVAMTVAAHAAGINWSIAMASTFKDANNENFGGEKTTAPGDVGVYLIDMAQKDAIITAIAQGTLSDTTDGIIYATTMKNRYGQINNISEKDGNWIKAGTEYDVATLYVDTLTVDGKKMYNLSVAKEDVLAANIADGLSSASFSANDVWANASGWQEAKAIPEPTSAMLLLLGVAGLALRRRRA